MTDDARRHAGFWDRLLRGSRWTWLDDRYRAALPADLDDDGHGPGEPRPAPRQARPVDGPGRLPRARRAGPGLPQAALTGSPGPRGSRRSSTRAAGTRPARPSSPTWTRVRGSGLAVPEVVAAGERIGPWGRLQSFLMVAELTGLAPAARGHPRARRAARPAGLRAPGSAAWSREMAEIAATLHRARVFHKDLYLCHFFLDMARLDRPGRRLALIDLHRLAEHRVWPDRWRWKDLGQLLFSTDGVAGLDGRDALRFWVALPAADWRCADPRRQARMIALEGRRDTSRTQPLSTPTPEGRSRACVWP